MTQETETAADATNVKDAEHVVSLADLQTEMLALQEALSQVIEERDSALAKLKAATEGAAKKAQVSRLPRADKPRACGPLPAKKALSGADLEQLLMTTAVEIRASDGKSEVRLFEPVSVSGAEAWDRLGNDRFMLRQPVSVQGAGPGDREPVLRGFGLFDAEGTQRHWQDLSTPLQIKAGSQYRIDRSIIFG